MKSLCGTIGFFVVAMITFRLVYGAWPPTEGNLGNWISTEPKAIWAMVAAIIAGMIGTFIGQTLPRILNEQERVIGSASELFRCGLRYHRQKRVTESIDMFNSPLIYAPARSEAGHAVRSALGGHQAAPGRENASSGRR